MKKSVTMMVLVIMIASIAAVGCKSHKTSAEEKKYILFKDVRAKDLAFELKGYAALPAVSIDSIIYGNWPCKFSLTLPWEGKTVNSITDDMDSLIKEQISGVVKDYIFLKKLDNGNVSVIKLLIIKAE